MLQLPFFIVAAYGLYYKLNWIKIPLIIYSAHVATTVIPILSEFYYSTMITDQQRSILIAFYFPYLLIPLMMLVQFSCSSDKPFIKSKKKKWFKFL